MSLSPAELESVDMEALRKRSVLILWSSFSSFSSAFLLALIWALTAHGWPTTPMTVADRTSVVAVAVLVSNVPDLLSVAIYARMWRHFRKKANSVYPANQPSAEEDADSGGVFPGGAVFLAADDDLEIQSQGEEDAAVKVMRTLRLHVLTSAFDLPLALYPLIPNRSVMRILGYHYSVIVTYWIPLYVIKSNFPQLDNILDALCQTF